MTDARGLWLARVGLFFAMVFWASSFVALKLAFRAYEPMTVIFGRMFVASLCFAALWRNFRSVKVKPGDLRLMLLMAFFEPCLYFIFESWALTQTSASQAGMITALNPLMVSVAAYFILKERLTRRTVFGFSLAIGGAVWLSLAGQPDESAPNPILGNFLEFVAMALATGYMIIVKKLTVRYSPLFLTAVQAFCGSLFFLPAMLLAGSPLPASPDLTSSLAVLYLGVVVTLGAYGLYNYGVSRIPASQASAFVNLIPVLTLIMGWLVLGERLTPLQYPASALVLLGVLVSQEREA